MLKSFKYRHSCKFYFTRDCYSVAWIKELDTQCRPDRGPSRWDLGPRFGLGRGRGKRRRRPYRDFWLYFRNRSYVGFLWEVPSL